MFNNWNHNKYIYIKNFMLEKNFLKIKKDIKDNFELSIKDKKEIKKSGEQTTSDLHTIFKSPHWRNYFNKLTGIMNDLGKEKLLKCWCLKINKKERNFFHKHPENYYTSVFYVQNDNYELGTQLKDKDNDIIIPGYENSILIFEGSILHDAVFPNDKLKNPRYTLITDYE